VRFSYRDNRDAVTARIVEPMRLVHTGRRWYLAAWDTARTDWRTFRVDRIQPQPRLTRGSRFVPREPPLDFGTLVSRSIASFRHRYHVRLQVKGAAPDMRARIPRWLGVLEPLDDNSCTLTMAGESYETIAALIAQSGVEFTLLGPPEAAEPLRTVVARLTRGMAGEE